MVGLGRQMCALSVSVILALAGTARADPGDRWDAATMGGQVIGGGLGGLVGGGVLGLAGLGIGFALQTNKNDIATPIICIAVGATLGGVTGTIIGVDYVGDHRNGTGSWYGTALGLVGGVLLTGTMKLVTDELHLRPPGASEALFGAMFILGGAVVGYQLTASAHPPVTMRLAAFTF